MRCLDKVRLKIIKVTNLPILYTELDNVCSTIYNWNSVQNLVVTIAIA